MKQQKTKPPPKGFTFKNKQNPKQPEEKGYSNLELLAAKATGIPGPKIANNR